MKRINISLLSFFLASTLLSCSKISVPYTQDGDWITRSQLNGPTRSEAVGFTIGNYTYLGTGWDGLTKRYADFWKYDPVNDSWSQVSSLPDTRNGDKAYISTGENGVLYTSTWEYDFATDLWKRKSSFEGPATTGAVGFNVQNKGYIATGRSGNGQAAQSDFLREFHPDDVLNPNND